MLFSKSVVDDMAVLAPFEVDVAQYWRSSLNCATGERGLRADPTTIAAQAERLRRGSNRSIQDKYIAPRPVNKTPKPI
jgi:hypothetical protein